MDPMDNPVSDLSTASNRVQQMQYRVCTEYTLSVSSSGDVMLSANGNPCFDIDLN